MKNLHLLLIVALSCFLTGCKVNRYYYIAEEPIALYEFPSFSGSPILTTSIGDTVSATRVNGIKLGGSVPVEYRGYSFYAPSARARFLRVGKVRIKRDAAVPGIAYSARLRYNGTTDAATVPGNYGYTPSTGATIHTGPRGGRYYINSYGNKTYIPRNSSSTSRTRSSYRSSSSSGSRSRSSGSSYRSSGGRGRH